MAVNYELLVGEVRGKWSLIALSGYCLRELVMISDSRAELEDVMNLMPAACVIEYCPTKEELAKTIAAEQLLTDKMRAEDVISLLDGGGIDPVRLADLRKKYDKLYAKHLANIEEYDIHHAEWRKDLSSALEEWLQTMAQKRITG